MTMSGNDFVAVSNAVSSRVAGQDVTAQNLLPFRTPPTLSPWRMNCELWLPLATVSECRLAISH